jgi:hypothetical protein
MAPPAYGDSSRLTRSHLWLVLPVAVVYLAIAIASARTQTPFVDEAWYVLPAWNLTVNGSMGTPVIEPSGSPMPAMNVNLTGVRQHTYWCMPLPMILEAAWFRAVGFSLLTTRLFSTVWAAALLCAWFCLLRRFSGSVRLALLGILLIASDEIFFFRASFGRMDVMSAALGFWGIEIFLREREKSLARALLFSNALVAAAGMSHPNGGMLSLLGLAYLAITLDRHRLKWRHAVFALFPYAIGGAAMGLYILQDPAAFKEQFFSNSSGRLSALSHPLSMVIREFMRYLNVYGFGAGVSALGRLKLLVLLVYAASLLYVGFRVDLRRKYSLFLGLAVVYIVGLAIVDDYKVQWYVVYTIPFFGAGTAVAAFTLASRLGRMPVTAIVTVIVAIQMGAILHLISENRYRNSYLPVVALLKSLAGPDTLIAGGSELGFGYGFKENLDDDIRLGFRSGRRPDLIVMDERYRTGIEVFRRTEPDVARYIDSYLAGNCNPRPASPEYTVYVCRSGSAARATAPNLHFSYREGEEAESQTGDYPPAAITRLPGVPALLMGRTFWSRSAS